MKLKLIPRTRKNGTLVLSLNYSFRVVFYLVALIVAGNILANIQSDFSLGPFIFSLLFFIFGSYQDTWLFNPTTKLIERKHGLFFIFKKKVVTFDELTSIHISFFTKGGMQADQRLFDDKEKWGFRTKIIIRLYLQAKDGRGIDVEVTEEKRPKGLKKWEA